MNRLALPAVAVIMIGGSATLAALGLLLKQHLVKRMETPPANDIVGVVFATVALLYSVILAFVVFAVWERFQASSHSVTNEAAAIVSAYRDTDNFPEPARSEARAAFRGYVKEVVANEWKSHGLVLPHRTRDALNPIWDAYRPLQSGTQSEQAMVSKAEDHLHDLEMQRHLRHLEGEATLPDVFWWLIVGGGIITVGMSYMFVMERTVAHTLLVALMAGLIAGVLSLILSLNFPFTGRVHVTRSPFRHALQEFVALDYQPTGPAAATVSTTVRTVVVDGRRSWTDTGVDVASGDVVAVTATGKVFHNPTSSTGPNGDDNPAYRQYSVLQQENHAALIGRIGTDGTPFAVGSDFSSAGVLPGRLFLGINDIDVSNNSGAFQATVTITHP